MNRFMIGLLMGAGLLAGCDSFVPPEVNCRATPTISLNMTQKPERPGQACFFPEVLDTVIMYAPAATSEIPGDLSLANVAVKVTAGAGAKVCDGPMCIPDLTVLETAIDPKGTLTYTVRMFLEAMGAMPSPGGSATISGVVALESYGPGNACPVIASGTITCEENEE